MRKWGQSNISSGAYCFAGGGSVKVTLTPFLFALLLLTAHVATLAHAYGHDIEAPQAQTCAACATADQLASACVGNPAATDMQRICSLPSHRLVVESSTGRAIVVRQRGPPFSL